MRRLIALAAIAGSGLAVAGIAAAAPPTRSTQDITISNTVAAGAFCDFNLKIEATAHQDTTTFSDGRVEIHVTASFTYTNLDTNAVVTGTEKNNGHFDSSGGKDTGMLLKLRDATGKLVDVSAGKLTYDSSFNIIGFTPNSDPSVRAVVCPALGGNPA